jgi:epoxyqueuosine reductase QueG
MSVTNEIKRYVVSEFDMDMVGVADIDLLSDEPEGYRPADILPGAKAVIVYGKRMPDGGVQAAFRKFEDGHPTAHSGYGAFCADLASNFTLFFHTFNLAQYIERTFGYATTPLPCGPMQCGVPTSVPMPAFAEPFKVGLPLNIERAAFASGLGDYGWSGRILTEEYGPRIQFGAVITRMELEPDAPYSGERLCRGESCRICSRICPVDAMPNTEYDEKRILGVRGHERNVANVKLNRCIVASCALRKEFGGMVDCIETCDPTEAELEEAFRNKPINHFEGLDHYPKWKCDKCLIYCPAGNWDKRFKETGLSRCCGGNSNA